MKKILILLLFSLVLTSCMTQPPSVVLENEVINDENIYITGKIVFDFEIDQEFEKSTKMITELYENKWYAAFSRNENKEYLAQEIPIDQRELFFYGNWNEYFICKLPKEELYLNSFNILLSNNWSNTEMTYLELYTRLKMEISQSDHFIYIGDIVFYKNGNDMLVKIEDNYENSENIYYQYIKDVNGEYILPVKNLLTGEDYVEAVTRKYITRVYYY